ncbi:MAG: type I pullulanase [Bacteroidota bacterium]
MFNLTKNKLKDMRVLPDKILLLFMAVLLLSFRPANDMTDLPTYTGRDLGITYSAAQTKFKIWAPTATEVKLRLYAKGDGGTATRTIDLAKGANGTWQALVKGDIKNQYYTFQTLQNGKWLAEFPDLYAKATGVNGKRGMVVNMAAINPEGWVADKKPALKNLTDAIIYELHVRDLSVAANSGIKHKGQFLGLTETGTKSPQGEATGLDHIKQLGVTHIHLLPSFDFNSVDETKAAPQYNWGYDPVNYNVPEGSYATNAYDGRVRIREFKQMVQTLHRNGLRVILDVVYNHTSDMEHSNFTQSVPGYFYRHNADGSYSNATACGNETASEKAMMRKFMIESVVYWAKEYHLDGFRFDLMGVHDIATMNMISDTLHKIDPKMLLYGEGWTVGSSPLPEDLRAVKKNTLQLNKIATFGDDMRDGLRGPFNDIKQKGFASGAPGTAESVKFGIVGAVQHPQIDYKLVNYSKAPWAKQPYQSIAYVSCHDDPTLFDRLKLSNPNAPEADLIKMDKLANGIVLTSQGIAFLHAGEEMLRTKKLVANSYNSPDSINELNWSRKTKYKEVFEFYRGVIALRKNHPAFRMPSADMIRQHLEFIETGDPMVIAYQLKNHANGDKWKNILVLINGNPTAKRFRLPKGNWAMAVGGDKINENAKVAVDAPDGVLKMNSTQMYVFYQK